MLNFAKMKKQYNLTQESYSSIGQINYKRLILKFQFVFLNHRKTYK